AKRELRNGRENSPGQPPLSGIRVIDASQGLCGPFLSLLLADAGAEVIKVEPPEGDYARGFAPQTKSGDSAAFTLLNRNKKSVALDKESEEGRKSLRNLLKGADIFIEDWAGEADRLGLGYDSLRKDNPGLIYCAITPFGEKGIYKDLKGSELVIQGMSDYWLSVGEIGSEPTRWGSEVANHGTASMALPAVLAALFSRNRTGEGQRIGISLWGTMLCYRQACWTLLGDIEEWVGPFCQAYTYPRMHGWRTKDIPIFLRLYNASDEDYVSLLLDLGMEESLADERFGNGGRNAVGTGPYAQELIPLWENHLKHMTADEVAKLVWSHNAVAFPMNNAKEVFNHPQVKALGVLKEMGHPILGKIQVLGPPFTGSWDAPKVSPAPKLNENRAEVLSS
ncbi:MAG: CoA transferase, partial [Chloroflexi bacterium]|nr:CoA transferase [Chloroflexota bacterium]